jgi:hypothetical protein
VRLGGSALGDANREEHAIGGLEHQDVVSGGGCREGIVGVGAFGGVLHDLVIVVLLGLVLVVAGPIEVYVMMKIMAKHTLWGAQLFVLSPYNKSQS